MPSGISGKNSVESGNAIPTTQLSAHTEIRTHAPAVPEPACPAELTGGRLSKKTAGTGNGYRQARRTLDLPNAKEHTDMTSISIITGASRGLGRNTALSIAQRGGDVIITYRSGEAEARAVVAQIEALGRKAVAIGLDVSDVTSFPHFAQEVRKALAATWGRDTFDHLVNNAGHGEMAPFAETTVAQFDALFNVHVKGVFFLTQALLPMLADGGRIINLSSGLTRVSVAGFSAYSTAKGAIETLSVYMAKELGSRGITVNTVAPGAIETDFLGGAVRDIADLNQQFAGMTALGRVGVPDDIGPMIASLLGADNRWVTAQRIEVSGGQTI
jgi:NAD(P)-dependent dehydrogenase (short-subunit alcohol dehydrogenase family)